MDLLDNNRKSLCRKEIFEELVREIFDEIIHLTDERNFNDFMYYLETDSAGNDFMILKMG